MQKCDLVVPGERSVGEGGRTDRQEPPGGRNREERTPQAGERQPTQVLEQEPGRYRDGAEPDDRPCGVMNALHSGVRSQPATMRPPRPPCPSKAVNARLARSRTPGAAAMPRLYSKNRIMPDLACPASAGGGGMWAL